MLLYKFSLEIYGEQLIVNDLIPKIQGKHLITDANHPNDLKWETKKEVYGFGSLTITHPQKIAQEYEIIPYEEWYIQFLAQNYPLFKQFGVADITLRLEIFYTEQCNFEFKPTFLGKIAAYNINLPISVYKVTETVIQNMINEQSLPNS